MLTLTQKLEKLTAKLKLLKREPPEFWTAEQLLCFMEGLKEIPKTDLPIYSWNILDPNGHITPDSDKAIYFNQECCDSKDKVWEWNPQNKNWVRSPEWRETLFPYV